MNWKVGKKVFKTEVEAIQYAKDIMARGGIVGWQETTEKVTHRYIFGNDCLTEPV